VAEESSGYRGRWKKWVLIYLAAAIVVYAIIYFVFLHKSGGSSGGGGYFVFALPYLLRGRRRRP
jgi:hypothetical protein